MLYNGIQVSNELVYLLVVKYPQPITLNTLSIDALEGSVQLNTLNCLFRRCGISFLPPETQEVLHWTLNKKSFGGFMAIKSVKKLVINMTCQ